MEEEFGNRTSRQRVGRLGVIFLVLLSLLGGILGGMILMKAKGGTTVLYKSSRLPDSLDIATSQGQMNASAVYAENVESTVGITTSISTNFWGIPSRAAASGSGFIISDDGYILTNYHVVEASEKITVTLFHGESFDGKLVGYDESNDIALLRIEANNLRPVILGDSDQLLVGEDVVAIGNPLGELTFSLTAGKISAKDREVTLSNAALMRLLQTDCAINSGNSGGALFNLYGEVIGVTNAKYSGSTGGASIDNIGFAIPINTVKPIVESLLQYGYVAKPYLGVSVTDVSQDMLLYGLPQGATVRAVEQGSPAELAGLQVGDIITKLDETPISDSRMLVLTLRDCQIGQQLRLTLYRKGETLEIKATVGQQKSNNSS